MPLASSRLPLLILCFSSLALARLLFALFNDPEGPNLLVVGGAALVVCALSVAAYVFGPAAPWKRFSLAILVQLLAVGGLYVLAIVA